MTIEVEPRTAELLERAKAAADQQGVSLADFLESRLPVPRKYSPESQLAAWNAFVSGMTELTKHLPPGHVVDDSREAMYDDRD